MTLVTKKRFAEERQKRSMILTGGRTLLGLTAMWFLFFPPSIDRQSCNALLPSALVYLPAVAVFCEAVFLLITEVLEKTDKHVLQHDTCMGLYVVVDGKLVLEHKFQRRSTLFL